MTVWGVARSIAAKDLRIERRSRVLTNQVLPFSGVVMVLFAFALDKANSDVPQQVAPGLVWMATVFSLLVMIQRVFAVERDDGALDALRVAGVTPAGLFLGKAMALAAQLVVLDALLILLAVVLFNSSVGGVGAAALLVITVVVAVIALAGVGTLYGGLAAGTKGRDTLLPLLMLPVVVPVLIGATRSTEAAFGAGGIEMTEGWAWVALVGAFAALAAGGGALAFGSLLEE